MNKTNRDIVERRNEKLINILCPALWEVIYQNPAQPPHFYEVWCMCIRHFDGYLHGDARNYRLFNFLETQVDCQFITLSKGPQNPWENCRLWSDNAKRKASGDMWCADSKVDPYFNVYSTNFSLFHYSVSGDGEMNSGFVNQIGKTQQTHHCDVSIMTITTYWS